MDYAQIFRLSLEKLPNSSETFKDLLSTARSLQTTLAAQTKQIQQQLLIANKSIQKTQQKIQTGLDQLVQLKQRTPRTSFDNDLQNLQHRQILLQDQTFRFKIALADLKSEIEAVQDEKVALKLKIQQHELEISQLKKIQEKIDQEKAYLNQRYVGSNDQRRNHIRQEGLFKKSNQPIPTANFKFNFGFSSERMSNSMSVSYIDDRTTRSLRSLNSSRQSDIAANN